MAEPHDSVEAAFQPRLDQIKLLLQQDAPTYRDLINAELMLAGVIGASVGTDHVSGIRARVEEAVAEMGNVLVP